MRRPKTSSLFLFAHLSDPHEPYNEYGPTSRGAEIRLDGEFLDWVTTSKMSYWEREVELAPGRHRLTITAEEPFKLRRFHCREGRDELPSLRIEQEY